MAKFFGCLTLLVAAALVSGGGSHCTFRAQTYRSSTYGHQIHQPYDVATYAQPYVVQVPAYGYGNYSQGTELQLLQAVKEFSNEVKNLRAEIANLRNGTGPTAPEENTEYLKVFRAKCASCHEKDVAAARGGGFTLLVGNNLPPQMDSSDILAVSSQVALGKMPKGGTLTDDEQIAIQKWVQQVAVQLKKEEAKQPNAPTPR